MAKGLFDIILDSIFDADWVGRRGEKLTEKELKWVNFFGRGGKILKNVYIPKPDGETSEIDVLYITQKGIFVIESKNYSGWIFGDEKSYNWTAMLPNKQKNKFYNPIKQNATHIKWLKNYLDSGIPLFSLIVFSERCELKKISVETSNIKVIKRDSLYATVRNIWDSSPDMLAEQDVDEIYATLTPLANVDEAVKMAHIDNINKNIYSENSGTYSEPPPLTQTLICPKCGSTLVERVAKKGANAGNSFYGCSGYPKCRYIQANT